MTVVKKKFQTVSDIVNSKQYGMFLAQENLYQIMVKSYEKMKSAHGIIINAVSICISTRSGF